MPQTYLQQATIVCYALQGANPQAQPQATKVQRNKVPIAKNHEAVEGCTWAHQQQGRSAYAHSQEVAQT